MSIPVLIAAHGDFHRNDASQFVKRHPELEVYAATDAPIDGLPESRIIKIGHEGFAAKIEGIRDFECGKFLYVDTDTTIHSLMWIDYFSSRYDISVAFEPLGCTENLSISKIPYALAPVEYNTGVILIKKTPAARVFIDRWMDAHLEGVAINGDRFEDQVSFRRAALLCNIPIGAMPANMNYRLMYNQLIAGPINIVHSRRPRSDKLAKSLARESAPRYIITPTKHVHFNSRLLKVLRFIIRNA